MGTLPARRLKSYVRFEPRRHTSTGYESRQCSPSTRMARGWSVGREPKYTGITVRTSVSTREIRVVSRNSLVGVRVVGYCSLSPLPVLRGAWADLLSYTSGARALTIQERPPKCPVVCRLRRGYVQVRQFFCPQ